MPITQQRDIEKGNNKRHENLSEPFIKDGSRNLHDSEETRKNESIAMVLVSTAVAVCGSLEFGTCFSLFGALSLDTGRFFTGYGIGIFSYVVPVYIAEISPKELRGGLTTINQLMIVTGSSIVFLLGTIVTWRTLALVGVVPPVLLVAGLLFIPESPRWLVGITLDISTNLQSLFLFTGNIPSI